MPAKHTSNTVYIIIPIPHHQVLFKLNKKIGNPIQTNPSDTPPLFTLLLAGMCRGFLDVFDSLKIMFELHAGRHLYDDMMRLVPNCIAYILATLCALRDISDGRSAGTRFYDV